MAVRRGLVAPGRRHDAPGALHERKRADSDACSERDSRGGNVLVTSIGRFSRAAAYGYHSPRSPRRRTVRENGNAGEAVRAPAGDESDHSDVSLGWFSATPFDEQST
jgi:hypothetical protein